jgi:acyl-CoA hydrolase
MPADTNANGDIFGGWVLSRMDQAGGSPGSRGPGAGSSPSPSTP